MDYWLQQRGYLHDWRPTSSGASAAGSKLLLIGSHSNDQDATRGPSLQASAAASRAIDARANYDISFTIFKDVCGYQ